MAIKCRPRTQDTWSPLYSLNSPDSGSTTCQAQWSRRWKTGLSSHSTNTQNFLLASFLCPLTSFQGRGLEGQPGPESRHTQDWKALATVICHLQLKLPFLEDCKKWTHFLFPIIYRTQKILEHLLELKSVKNGGKMTPREKALES